jgi:hypothetical protein
MLKSLPFLFLILHFFEFGESAFKLVGTFNENLLNGKTRIKHYYYTTEFQVRLFYKISFEYLKLMIF